MNRTAEIIRTTKETEHTHDNVMRCGVVGGVGGWVERNGGSFGSKSKMKMDVGERKGAGRTATRVLNGSIKSMGRAAIAITSKLLLPQLLAFLRRSQAKYYDLVIRA